MTRDIRNIRTAILSVALSAVAVGLLFNNQTPVIDEQAILRELAPGASFTQKGGTPPHYLSEGLVAFNTHDISPSVRGYAGPIKTLVVMDRQGRITGLRIIDHRETKNYVHYMETPEYLSRFIGRSVNDPLEIGSDIDGISRATISVQALARSVRESSVKAASDLLGVRVLRAEAGRASEHAWIIYTAYFSAAFFCYFMTRHNPRFLYTRDVSLVLGLIIPGIYLSTPFSMLQLFNMVLFGPSNSYLWLALVISTAISVLLAGRFYCGWICPFGALSELLGRLPVRKWNISSGSDGDWRRLKYPALGISIAAALAGRRPESGNYETYVTLFSLSGSYLSWGLVGLTLIANVRVRRFWCRYLCPVAALTGLLSRSDNRYVSNSQCPMDNRPGPHISECIRCNRCFVRTERTGEQNG
ncbi:MAG: 4Fe-4S binding protein [Nitrospirae bacterium]|nr:4Fe-4S binding protein [Nitrospirota bacterium]